MLCLCDCYDQFTWSSPSHWTVLLSVYFNAIAIRWATICLTSCIRRIAVFSDLLPVFLPLVIVPFLRLVPLVVVVFPFCVFSQSKMLNASLISSFIRLIPVLIDWFQQFPVLFDWFQHFPVLFDWFQHYPVLWPGSAFSLSFSSGPFYKKCTCYTCNTSSAFSLYLCDLFVQFCSLLTKLYDILRGNSHWPYSLTKYFTFTIVWTSTCLVSFPGPISFASSVSWLLWTEPTGWILHQLCPDSPPIMQRFYPSGCTRRIRWSCEGLTSVHNEYTGWSL